MNLFEKNRQRWIVSGVLAGLVLLGAGLGLFSYYFENRCYKQYQIQGKVERSDSNNVQYMYHEGNILKYSRSGISEIDNEGKSLWNGGYEMKQPQVDVCGEYIVVADIGGKQFYVYNGENDGTVIETSLPIVRAKVAGQGVTAVLLQDKDSNVLNLYNPNSNAESLLVEIPTNVAEEGYPLDFDISSDGKSVVTSYLAAKGSSIETKINFYNFTEVGKDSNTLVGGQSFGDKMIAGVEFVEDDKVAVFHEKGVSVFEHMKQPEKTMEKDFSEDIKSFAFGNGYMAVVLEKDGKIENQKLILFDEKGKEKLNKKISYEYADVEIYGEEIVFTGNRSCNILRFNGHDKFAYRFEEEIDAVYPTSNGRIYTLIDMSTIQKIKLKTK